MKRYLLGNLSQEKTLEIDLQVISNPDLEENLIIAEENLIEEFLEGELTESEKELFIKNFLISDERRLQVQTISQLKNLAEDLEKESITDGTSIDSGKNFFLKLINLFKLKPALAISFFIFLVLAVGGLGLFIYFNDTNGLTDLEMEYVQLNQGDFKDLSGFDEFSRIILIGGQTRSSDRSNELIKRKMSERVLFNLALPTEKKANGKWTIELRKDNQTVFRQTEIPVYRNEFGSELRFVLPAKILELGKYDLIARSENDSTKRIFYSFSVR